MEVEWPTKSFVRRLLGLRGWCTSSCEVTLSPLKARVAQVSVSKAGRLITASGNTPTRRHHAPYSVEGPRSSYWRCIVTGLVNFPVRTRIGVTLSKALRTIKLAACNVRMLPKHNFCPLVSLHLFASITAADCLQLSGLTNDNGHGRWAAATNGCPDSWRPVPALWASFFLRYAQRWMRGTSVSISSTVNLRCSIAFLYQAPTRVTTCAAVAPEWLHAILSSRRRARITEPHTPLALLLVSPITNRTTRTRSSLHTLERSKDSNDALA